VKRGEGDTESIRKSLEVLERGGALLIFPEGTRGDGDQMLPINRGVAMLAKRTRAPVIPVGIVNSHKVLRKQPTGKMQRHTIRIVWGEPFRYEDVAVNRSERENREAFAHELQRRILELCRGQGMDLRSATDSTAPPTSLAPGHRDEAPDPDRA
jgi:1-acyl-sn-glycerol-3-phosphate acyltransferase